MQKSGKVRALASLLAAAALTLPSAVQAESWKHGARHDHGRHVGHYRGHHGPYHHGRYHHGGRGWAPLAVLGGLAAGYAIVDSQRYYYTPPPRGYVPPSVYGPRPCRTVYRLDMVDGYESKTGATLCYDERGIAYIVRGSEFPVDERVVYQSRDIKQTLQTECRMTLRGVWFDFDKATLKRESDQALGEVLDLLQDDPGLSLDIEGHTDSVGSDEYNMQLSRERADAVADWLVEHGVDESRLGTTGFGESMPVADNGTDAGRAENRRVEIVNPACEQ